MSMIGSFTAALDVASLAQTCKAPMSAARAKPVPRA
jgi:hypothetical protein